MGKYAPDRVGVVVGVAVIAGAIVLVDRAMTWHGERQDRLTSALPLDPEQQLPLDRPNIKAVRIFTDARAMIAVGASGPHAHIHCAHVIFKNLPTRGSHPDAQVSDVLAEIKFVRHGQPVLTISPGRWGDTDPPAVRKARDPFASLIDLNAIPFRIGEEHELDVAIRHPGQA